MYSMSSGRSDLSWSNQTDGAMNRVLGLLATAESVLEQIRLEERASGVNANDRVFRVVPEQNLVVEGQGVLLQVAAKLDQSRRTGEPPVVKPTQHRLNGFASLLIVAAGLGGLFRRPFDLGAKLGVVSIAQGDDRQHRDDPDRRGCRLPGMTPGPLEEAAERPYPTREDRLSPLESTQVLGQAQRRGIPLAGCLIETFQADGLQVARDVGPEASRWHDLGGRDQLEGLDRRLAQERRAAGQGVVQDRAQGIGVGGRADLLRTALGLLGSHVIRRAHDLAGQGVARVGVEELGQAEVTHLGNPVDGHEHITRLEIAVDDPGPVGGVHGAGEGLHQRGGLARGMGFPAIRWVSVPPSANSRER